MFGGVGMAWLKSSMSTVWQLWQPELTLVSYAWRPVSVALHRLRQLDCNLHVAE